MRVIVLSVDPTEVKFQGVGDDRALNPLYISCRLAGGVRSRRTVARTSAIKLACRATEYKRSADSPQLILDQSGNNALPITTMTVLHGIETWVELAGSRERFGDRVDAARIDCLAAEGNLTGGRGRCVPHAQTPVTVDAGAARWEAAQATNSLDL